MILSKSFTLEALIFSETAIRKGISNEPSDEQIQNLTELAQSLERVRDLVGELHISSGFRSPKLNTVIGGSVNSAHTQGYAADFTASGFGSPLDVCKAIEGSGISFDQLIMEGGKNGGWTHISVDPRMRQEVLTATFINGTPIYAKGIVQETTKAS
jgi:hypothetical protein